MAPSANGPAESSVVGETVTETDTSASLSRRVRKMVRPDRRLISISCASTHTGPSRSIQPRTRCAIRRSGCGLSGEDSRGTA